MKRLMKKAEYDVYLPKTDGEDNTVKAINTGKLEKMEWIKGSSAEYNKVVLTLSDTGFTGKYDAADYDISERPDNANIVTWTKQALTMTTDTNCREYIEAAIYENFTAEEINEMVTQEFPVDDDGDVEWADKFTEQTLKEFISKEGDMIKVTFVLNLI